MFSLTFVLMETCSRDVVVLSAWQKILPYNYQAPWKLAAVFCEQLFQLCCFIVCYCFLSSWLFPDWIKIHFLPLKIACSGLNSQNRLKTGSCICFSKWFVPSLWPVLSSAWWGKPMIPAPCARITQHSWSWCFMLRKREWNAQWGRGGIECDTCQMSHLALLRLACG